MPIILSFQADSINGSYGVYLSEFSFLIGWLFESLIPHFAVVPQRDKFLSIPEAVKSDLSWVRKPGGVQPHLTLSLAALAEDLGSVCSSHMTAHTTPSNSGSWDLMSSSSLKLPRVNGAHTNLQHTCKIRKM